jgi:hypothetical protein
MERIGRAENLVIANPSRTRKSHFTEGHAPAAIEINPRLLRQRHHDGLAAPTVEPCAADRIHHAGHLKANQPACRTAGVRC